MLNLDITFDNAYEYDDNDCKGSYHHIKNNDVGLRINSRNDDAMFIMVLIQNLKISFIQ